MTVERSQGLMRDFRFWDSLYLSMAQQDLQLAADIPFLQKLQQIYKDEKRDPHVDELVVDVEFANRSRRFRDADHLTEVASYDNAIPSLFAQWAKDINTGRDRCSLPLTAFFDSLFGPVPTPESGTFFLTSASSPVFPTAPASRVIAATPAFLLTWSPHRSRGVHPSATDGILVLPAPGNSPLSFIETASRFLKEIYDAIPEAFVQPCSEQGLLSDALALCSNPVLFAGGIPGAENVPQAVLSSYAPGFLLMVPKVRQTQAVQAARRWGFLADVPVHLGNPDKNIGIYSRREPVHMSSTHLQRLREFRYYTVHAVEQLLPAVPPSAIAVKTEAPVEVFFPAGRLYEALEDICAASGCAYAFALEMNPKSPDTVPLLLTLRAFLRNHRIIAASAVCTEAPKNRLTVFRLGIEVTESRYDPLLIPPYLPPVAEKETVNETVSETE